MLRCAYLSVIYTQQSGPEWSSEHVMMITGVFLTIYLLHCFNTFMFVVQTTERHI